MKHLAVLTSGGDAPGMNAAVRAVVRTAAAAGVRVTGVADGYQGLLDGAFSDLTTRSVSSVIQLGGTLLGTSRCPGFHEPEGRAQAFGALKRRGVEGLVVIGGNGSYQGAIIFHREHGLPVMGLPGTIDNDVVSTNFTIGFDTAVNTAIQAIDRIRDTAHSLDRAFFIEVMGRKSGAIAVASAIAGGAEAVLVPEEQEPLARVLDRLREASARGKRSLVVVVAEGALAGGAQELAHAAEAELGIKGRVTVLGHVQRGGSPTALDRILASRMGVAAVRGLIAGERFTQVVVRGGQIELRPLDEATPVQDALRAELLDVCRELAH